MVTVATLIERAAGWYGDAVAVVDGRRSLTFRDVDRRANRLANALLELSPRPGGRVALLSANRAELVEADFAIAKSGKIRVPINTRLAEAERRYILQDSGADVLIVDADNAAFAVEAADSIETLAHVLVMGAATRPAGTRDYEEVLAAGSPRPPAIEHPPDAGAFMLYTSGTTGRPKGALATNAGRLSATMAMLTDELVIPPDGAMAHVGSMAHGSGSKVLAYFLRGARNITVPKWDPEQFLDLVQEQRVSGTFVVPTMLSALVEAWRTRRTDLSSLRSLTYGGAPIAPERLRDAIEVFGDALVQVYGSCEALHPVLVLSRQDHVTQRGIKEQVTSVGRVALHCDVDLRDDEGRPVAPGEPGELWIRGPNVMAGYWRNDQATAEALVDGWYRSGDIAWRDEDGYHYIVDRKKDMIISGGLNVYPAEVENAIYRHPGVAEVAVIGVPDPTWGESVKAIVVRRPGVDVTAEDIIEHCRGLLAGYKKPRFVEFVAELPKGATGKILKRQLRDAHWRDSGPKV